MVFGQLLPIKPTTNFGRIRRSTGLPFLDPEEFTLYLGFLFTPPGEGRAELEALAQNYENLSVQACQ